MFNRFTNLRLSAKALLAMSLSFLVNIAWLVAMWNNSMQTQALSVKEKQQANFVETINESTQLYYQLQAAFVTAFSSVNASDHQFFNSLNTRYTKLLSELETKPGLVDHQKAVLAELGKFARYQQNLLDDVYNNADDHDWHRFVLYRRQFLKMLRETFDDKRDVKEFLMPQRLELDRLHRNQEHSEKLFVILLICGVSANFILAVLIHFAFGRYVTRRINTLVENAKALSRKGTLLPPLLGKDDFAIVDGALHDSARHIEAAFAQKQALMQMIAHDLRSPLTATQVSLETMLAKDSDSLSASNLTTVNRVVGNNMRLIALINDLLTIDALELGHLDLTIQPEEIKKCVDEAVETLAASALARHITLHSAVGNDVGLFDYRRILQVLVNLISNAIKFSETNSQITINCEKTREGKLKISVNDKGKGIAKKDHSKLFQKYFQADEGKLNSGSGLGLAISKLIVDAHHETIAFKSEQSKGSTFWFTVADGEAD